MTCRYGAAARSELLFHCPGERPRREQAAGITIVFYQRCGQCCRVIFHQMSTNQSSKWILLVCLVAADGCVRNVIGQDGLTIRQSGCHVCCTKASVCLSICTVAVVQCFNASLFQMQTSMMKWKCWQIIASCLQRIWIRVAETSQQVMPCRQTFALIAITSNTKSTWA